jgi:hypothetical protein
MTGRWTRLLTAALPAIEGHNVNLGTGSADVTSLAEQAQSLITEDPQPQLVLIATLNADIQCPAGQNDFDAYGEALKEVLHELSAKMPGSRFFITTQISTPRQDATVYPRQARASLGGTGPCAFIDPTGAVVLKELKQLETVVAGFKAQVTAACAQTDRCSTDQSGKGWRMRTQYSDDLNHLSLDGQAKSRNTSGASSRRRNSFLSVEDTRAHRLHALPR